MQYLAAISKTTEWSLFFPRQPFNITVMELYPPTTNAEEDEAEQFYEDLQDLLELTPKKDILCTTGDWETKVGKSRDTWSNRQVWPWSTEWSRAKAERELTGHSKYRLPTTQETTLHVDITRWSILKSNWLYSLQSKMENLYTISKNKTGRWLWLRPWTPYFKIQT